MSAMTATDADALLRITAALNAAATDAELRELVEHEVRTSLGATSARLASGELEVDGASCTPALLDAVRRQVSATAARTVRFERARQANAAKDRFLSLLGHELRNPLAPIFTATQLMKVRAPDQLVKERTTIERGVQNLTKLVDELLEVTRAMSGRLEITKKPVTMQAVVTRAIDAVRPFVEERGLEVSCNVDPDLSIDADEGYLANALARVLHNAAKHTPGGGTIDVATSLANGEVSVSVTDRGPGIPADALPHVFDLLPTQRTTRPKNGLGIGLVVAKKIVDAHGGKISVQCSGPDQGCTFTIAVPRLVATRTTGKRILVVDDNQDAAWLLAEALRLVGHDVEVTHDGLEGLEVARGWSPEIAFLDLGLPGIDGFELCRRLAELPKRPKVVAVTGYGAQSDRDRANAAGFDSHLVKPVSLREVRETIERFSTLG